MFRRPPRATRTDPPCPYPPLFRSDRIISAVGVQGNIENLGLESTKVKTDRGIIQIDEYGRTAEPGIYAIGDVAGPPMLAHKAEHEGVICVEKIAGLNDVDRKSTRLNSSH